MAISVLNEEKIFKLDAGSSSYVMAVMGGGRLIHLYYGARISDSRVKFLAKERGVASFWAIPAGEADEFSTDVMPMEYSGAGTADLRPAAIASADEEGDNVTDLLFDSYQVIEGKPDYPGLPHTSSPSSIASASCVPSRAAGQRLTVSLSGLPTSLKCSVSSVAPSSA